VAGLVAGAGLSGGQGRDAGAGGSSWGLVVRRLAGQAPGGKAASGAGSGDGLMVMVTVQPGWSFWIWRSSQAWRCPGDSRRVFFVGNQAKRQHVFMVLGLFYPPRVARP
jgi:hypothetical protein